MTASEQGLLEELGRLRHQVAALEGAEARRQDAEAALRRSQEFQARVLEAVPGGVVQVGPDGKVLRANPHAQRFLGLTYDELSASYITDFAGKTYLESGAPCPVEAYPVARCLMTGEPQPPMTIGVEQRTGEVHWALFTAIPLPFPEGRHGAVVTFVDITSRKHAEEQRALLQEKLLTSDRLATVGTLAAGVAHELNNPLTYVLGNLALLKEACADGDRALGAHKELLDRALDGADRMRRIIGDLKTFSRSSDEQAPRPVDVCAAVESAVHMCGHEIRHRARLVLQFHSRPFVAGNEARLCQVLVNLLVNAAQAITPGDTARQRILVDVREQAGTVRVSVEDSGTGLPSVVLPRIFDPFFTTKPVGVGTGLGLSICRNIIQEMGGTISARNADSGAVFTVELPAAAPAPSPGTAAATELPRAARRGRILVVDDEPAVTELLARALVDHQVTAVNSGRLALELCRAEPFDLILCDVMMPDVSGVAVHDGVRALPGALQDRIVFMTAGASTAALRAQLDALGNPRLDKPFDVDRVRALVQRQLELQAAGA